MSENFEVTVTQTATLSVKGHCCAVDLPGGTVNGRCALYRDGHFERELAWQRAHPDDESVILRFILGIYHNRIKVTAENVQTLPVEQWGPNEHYMASLMAAAQGEQNNA